MEEKHISQIVYVIIQHWMGSLMMQMKHFKIIYKFSTNNYYGSILKILVLV
jgi:hypothetical protein